MRKSDFSIPVDLKSFKETGWKSSDVTLITGDTYVDHPSFGVAIIARLLESQGFKVLVISQPDSHEELSLFPPPRYFFGITSGNMDSMVSNYTASGKPRKSDAYSLGSKKRPNRAVIVYSNWVKRVYKDVPILIGGIEASLRRFGHYDWWQNKIRHSILLDSKADLLFFGMSELALMDMASLINRGVPLKNIKYLPGTAFFTTKEAEIPQNALELPSFESIKSDMKDYNKAYKLFYTTNTTSSDRTLFQRDANRTVVQNPPSRPLTQAEMDFVYALPFTKEIHPNLRDKTPLKALESVKSTIVTHRGCYGECSFCAIALHQGRTVQSRSISSIVKEVSELSEKTSFNGTITDLGGPTANMYGFECVKKLKDGPCERKSCLFPNVCSQLKPDHGNYLKLLSAVEQIEGVKHVYISSGIRPDLIYSDKHNGSRFMEELTKNHTSGLLKLAPEHFSQKVLSIMGKNTKDYFDRLYKDFYAIGKKNNLNQFICAYIMVGHPGEGEEENLELERHIKRYFSNHEQPVQIFTPTPSSVSTTIYYTGHDPFTEKKIIVIKSERERTRFKKRALSKLREDKKDGKNESVGKRKTGKGIRVKRGKGSRRTGRR